MYKVQKELGNINNGESYITIPNIRKSQIMDKCILNDLSKQISMDIEALNHSIYKNNNNVEKLFTLISNVATNLTNTISELESIKKIKDTNDTTIYEENFVNAINIDMKSNVDLDFNNNNCSLPSITTKIFNFDTVYIDGKLVDVKQIAYQEFSKTLTLTNKSSTKIKCSFKDSKIINNIFVDLQASTNINYEVFNIINDEYYLIDSGTSSSSIIINFYPINIKDIEIRILPVEETATAYINNIYCSIKAYKRYGEIRTKPLKIYSGSRMKAIIDTNFPKNIKSYIGFINKDNEVVWNSGDTYTSFQLFNEYTNLISNGSTNFGTLSGDKYIVTPLKENYNKNDVEVYSGYGMWHCTLIEGAFMNEDLSVLEYNANDVVTRTYVDSDECSFEVKAGQLFILEQQIECKKETEIKFPKLESFPVGTDNKTSLFRYSITVNGERIDNTMTVANYFDTKLIEGTNTIQIVLNLKKMDTTSAYVVKMFNYFNAKEYSDFIYHKKLKQSSTSSLINDIYRDSFSISNDSILVNYIDKTVDRFMVIYETLIDSDIHYVDYNGQYMKVIVMAKIFNDNSYNNIKINKISLIN